MSEAAARDDQRRIAELIATLEALPDPEAQACAKELVQGVLEMHAAGLERLLAILADSGESGRSAVEAMARDESVSALLLLHGLHPHDLRTRVRHAVNQLHAQLGARGVRTELLDASEQSVRVRLTGRWQGKGFSAAMLTHEIEEAIFAVAPDVAAVEIEGLSDINVHAVKFMPAPARRAQRVGESSP